MGPRTRSCSQQNTVREVPSSDEQEERNVQAALAQTALDEAARTVARDTLQRRAQLHNLRIVEKGGDSHEYFHEFLTDEEREPDAWRGLLNNILHLDGNARRWGGDLEISALSCMFQ